MDPGLVLLQQMAEVARMVTVIDIDTSSSKSSPNIPKIEGCLLSNPVVHFGETHVQPHSQER